MTAALITIAVLLVAAVIVVLARRRVHPTEQPLEGVIEHPGPAPRGGPLPLVLVHGLFRFVRVGIPGMWLH